jgi:hypothetical protein
MAAMGVVQQSGSLPHPATPKNILANSTGAELLAATPTDNKAAAGKTPQQLEKVNFNTARAEAQALRRVQEP